MERETDGERESDGGSIALGVGMVGGQSERAKPQNIGNADDDASCGIAAGDAVEEANILANTLLVELVELVLVAEAFRHIAAGVGGESPIGFSANSVTRNREREDINPE